jgi:hypothetical protein
MPLALPVCGVQLAVARRPLLSSHRQATEPIPVTVISIAVSFRRRRGYDGR